MNLSIIIPCLNEEHRIEKTLIQYVTYFPSSVEFIVVDNGSEDGTVSIVERLSKTHPNILLYSYPTALGKGGAIYRGFSHASADLLGYTDADGAIGPKEFEKIYAAISQTETDLAISSRYNRNSVVAVTQSYTRRLLSRLFNLYVRVLFNLPYPDTQCGAKIITRDLYEKFSNQLVITNYAFDVELLWRARLAGGQITVVPITWIDQAGSRFSTWRSGLNTVVELSRLFITRSFTRSAKNHANH